MAAGSPGGAKHASAELAAPPPLDTKHHALFLDLDGTLLEIEARPELVRAEASLVGLLARLCDQMDGACAIVTGRTLENADRIIGGAVDCVSGLHGQELRLNGRMRQHTEHKRLREAASELERLVRAGALDARLEDKGGGVALHYRETPEHERLINSAAEEVARAHDLQVMHGKMVVELLPQEASKQTAVSQLMEAAPFAGRTPVMLGDDVTDEDAFKAAWAHGGWGVVVGATRDTCARYRLSNVSAVHAWLAEGVR